MMALMNLKEPLVDWSHLEPKDLMPMIRVLQLAGHNHSKYMTMEMMMQTVEEMETLPISVRMDTTM